MTPIACLFLIAICCSCISSQKYQKPTSTDKWKVIQIDSTRQSWGIKPFEWLRGFGVDAQDVNNDGYKDIVAGWYFYINPGGHMQSPWQRYELFPKADGLMFTDVDHNGKADFIAVNLPQVYWFEVTRNKNNFFKVKQIGQIPATDHINGQGYKMADINNDNKPEILIKGKDGVYAAQNPTDIQITDWRFTNIAPTLSSEEFDVVDINNDGLPDIVSGDADDTTNIDNATALYWYKNPGNLNNPWPRQLIGHTILPIDRIRAADLNGDGKIEIVVTEEKWDQPREIANIWVFKEYNKKWMRQLLGTHYSLNSLDIGDVNKDGSPDIITSEHKGPNLNVYLYLNDKKGNFSEHIIVSGVEMHLGCKLVDLDNDGDLDIIGPAWDTTGIFTIIRNDNK